MMNNEKGKPLVYLAGPITVGDINENLRNAMEAGTKLIELGCDVIIPQLSIVLERYWKEEGCAFAEWGYKEWLDYDFHLIAKCDALYRMEGESPGSDREVAFALGRRIPAFDKIYELKGWLNNDWKGEWE